MAHIEIREATQTDSEMELLRLGEKESFQFKCPQVTFDEQYYIVRFEMLFSEDSKLFFLWEKLVPVAYIALNFRASSSSVNINSLYVAKSSRGKGYAKKLIKRVKGDVKVEKITLQVVPDNKAAFELYRKLGFNITRYDMEWS